MYDRSSRITLLPIITKKSLSEWSDRAGQHNTFWAPNRISVRPVDLHYLLQLIHQSILLLSYRSHIRLCMGETKVHLSTSLNSLLSNVIICLTNHRTTLFLFQHQIIPLCNSSFPESMCGKITHGDFMMESSGDTVLHEMMRMWVLCPCTEANCSSCVFLMASHQLRIMKAF